MILEVAGFFEPRGPRLTPSREPSGPFAGAKSPETARPTTLVDGADDWAVETTPSPEDVAAFVSPSGKFDDDASPRVAPDEALSVVLAPRCSSLPTWATARAGHQGTTNSATPGVRVSRSWWREICAPMDELSAHASNRRPALKNEAYRVSTRPVTPDVVLETPELSRDGAVRRGEAAPRRALGLVPAQARGWRVGAVS